jgi:ATP-dependent Clp protease ATP-binding subunit ClpA
VTEPSKDDTIKILTGLKPYFEKHHRVDYTDDAIRAAAELSAKYMTDRKLPDKAIDVIDEAGARQMLFPEAERKKTIDTAEIEEVVAKMARIPPKSVSKTDTERLKKLGEDLGRVVFGQDEAIEQLATAIKLSRAPPGSAKPKSPSSLALPWALS